jgi:hypothetical protein
MVAGRPRTSVPEKEELIKLGQDLLAWASEKQTDELRCRWCEWYAKKHFFIRKQWKRMIDTEEFRPYYESSQAYLSEKWIDGTINSSIAHRYLRIYDPELREQEDADKDEDVERKLKVAAAQPVNPFIQKLMEIDGKTEELVGRSSD